MTNKEKYELVVKLYKIGWERGCGFNRKKAGN